MSKGFFDAIGVSPAAGRTFTRDEMAKAVRRLVVVSYEFWRQTLGEAPLEEARVEASGL